MGGVFGEPDALAQRCLDQIAGYAGVDAGGGRYAGISRALIECQA